eukprot:CAMPEP_0204230688 /NCGR_PEP_ID=MMETSP0361-20130328/88161_1 /ASSEMBLY_ACC=CAM_ASM_000343 /TAXON_ID=268821 /ORGANISM="Scrippsiella Hangoei, Strain SHTV-5" /LENGTH=41 /DNA_ID= /DNA_START= /DNA_END= /DNA_ORIENTATION=
MAWKRSQRHMRRRSNHERAHQAPPVVALSQHLGGTPPRKAT